MVHATVDKHYIELHWRKILYNSPDRDLFKPPKPLLDRCRRVMLKDPKHRLHDIRRWCHDNLDSFIWWEFHTGNHNEDYEQAGVFWIGDDKDVVLFNLKWA